MRKAVGLLFIKNNEILLVREKDDFWKLPGGKPESRESDIECLKREIKEELDTDVFVENFYGRFIGITPHRRDLLEGVAYFGYFTKIMTPSREIDDAEFVSNPSDYPLSDITKKIIDSLKRDHYI
jgi:8-oxo-dGTP pyrophosphatase MutT (NUDIX family)